MMCGKWRKKKKKKKKNYVTNSLKKINNMRNNSCFTNSLRKYEKDLLQNIMYWKRFLASQRFILIVPSEYKSLWS